MTVRNWSAAFAMASMLCCAAPSLTKAPAQSVADIGKCFLGATASDPSLVRWLGSLFSQPNGMDIVSGLLTGPGSQMIACSAAELATMGRAEGPASDNGVFGKGDTIWRRADECLAGPCDRAELKAARVLRELYKAGKLKLPPSGGADITHRVQHRI